MSGALADQLLASGPCGDHGFFIIVLYPLLWTLSLSYLHYEKEIMSSNDRKVMSQKALSTTADTWWALCI